MTTPPARANLRSASASSSLSDSTLGRIRTFTPASSVLPFGILRHQFAGEQLARRHEPRRVAQVFEQRQPGVQLQQRRAVRGFVERRHG